MREHPSCPAIVDAESPSAASRAIQATLTTTVNAFRLGLRDAVTLTLLDEAALHLRDHAEHSEHHVPHLATCRYVRVENGDVSAALLALMDEIEHVARIAPEPIKASHH